MLEVSQLGKTYGEGENATHAIGSISFGIEEKEFVCVVGPSGCGKTTLLKCMSGLLEPTRGEVRLRGERVAGPPESMALVFQEYSRSLLPWLSVRGNVVLPLRLAPVTFAATMSVFFFVINLSKWIPYGWLGLLDWRNMSTSLALLPFAPFGVLVGVRLAHRIQPRRFYQLIYLGMLLTGVKLVWDAWA